MLRLLAVVGLLALSGGSVTKQNAPEPADLVVLDAKILTVDEGFREAKALAVRNGRFVAVGSTGDVRAYVGDTTRVIDGGGRTVIPGLIDTHVHFLRCGQNPGHEVRIIETAASIAELQQMIRARIAELKVLPGQELVNFITCIGGWNTNGLAEKRLPSVAELDAAAPGIPVYLSTTGAGGAVTNTPGAAFFTSRGIAVAANGTLNAGQASSRCRRCRPRTIASAARRRYSTSPPASGSPWSPTWGSPEPRSTSSRATATR